MLVMYLRRCWNNHVWWHHFHLVGSTLTKTRLLSIFRSLVSEYQMYENMHQQSGMVQRWWVRWIPSFFQPQTTCMFIRSYTLHAYSTAYSWSIISFWLLHHLVEDIFLDLAAGQKKREIWRQTWLPHSLSKFNL